MNVDLDNLEVQNDGGSSSGVSWWGLFRGKLFLMGGVFLFFVLGMVINFRRDPMQGLTGVSSPVSASTITSTVTVVSYTVAVLPTSTPVPTYTPLPTYTPVPTSTPVPTYTPLPTYTPVSLPSPVFTPVPTYTPMPTATPFFGFEPLPSGFNPGWCVMVALPAVYTPAGDKFSAGDDGYVYLSADVLNLPLTAEFRDWYYPVMFRSCGRYVPSVYVSAVGVPDMVVTQQSPD